MRLRRTPCVGVCSTTYGDLVCRGCKRFAHEIVGWNGYREEQRELVWARLNQLLADSVRVFVTVVDEGRLRTAVGRDAGDAGVELLAYQALRRSPASWVALGLQASRHLVAMQAEASAAHAPNAPGDREPTVAAALQAIDREFYLRSCGTYEHSFKVPI